VILRVKFVLIFGVRLLRFRRFVCLRKSSVGIVGVIGTKLYRGSKKIAKGGVINGWYPSSRVLSPRLLKARRNSSKPFAVRKKPSEFASMGAEFVGCVANRRTF